MKIDKKKVESAAKSLLHEINANSDFDIIQAVINEKSKDQHIIASASVGHTSYEIWKKKTDSQFDVVKSSYPKEKTDFKKVFSKKQIKEEILVDIINNLIKTFSDNENDRKAILEKLNENL